MVTFQEFVVFIKSAKPMVGFPLVVAGVALMMYGWRVWKLTVLLAFGAIGVLAARAYVPLSTDQWIYVAGAGIALAGASYFFANQAVAVLGGLLVTAMAATSLRGLGLRGSALLAACAVVFAFFCAYAFLNRRLIVISVSAFIGATLLASGMYAWLMTAPQLFGAFTNLLTSTSFAIPFALLVPTVMSAFYQVSEVHKLNIEL